MAKNNSIYFYANFYQTCSLVPHGLNNFERNYFLAPKFPKSRLEKYIYLLGYTKLPGPLTASLLLS